MKNNEDSYKQFLSDLRRGASHDDDLAPTKKVEQPTAAKEAQKPAVKPAPTNQGSLEDRIAKLELSQNRMRSQLSEHFSWVATLCLVGVVVEIILIALCGFVHLAVQPIPTLFNGTTLIGAVVIIIVNFLVYRHYDDLANNLSAYK